MTRDRRPLPGALILLAAMPLFACSERVAGLDCNEIGARAQRLSQQRPIRIVRLTDVRETSRTSTEARCAGNVTLADGGTAPLYFRAYEENGNTNIGYQGTPFAE
jgi:hypothetical protein